MAYNPPNRYPNNVVIPGNMIDASVFNKMKILNMIEKSVLPQLPNTSANQAMIPQVGTENFYKWMDIIMTQPNADPKSKARRRVHVITRHLVY